MSDLPIIFVSGLPRSGSTLLMQLLGQNPANHVTPTNDLIELVVRVRDSWQSFDGFKSQGLKQIEPRIRSTLRGMIEGFYRDEFAAGQTIFDKSRGWPAYIELLEELLERPVKVIVTIRDIRNIVASFEKLHRKHSLTEHAVGGPEYFKAQTVKGRTECLIGEAACVGLAVNRLMDAIDRGLSDRLIVVPYNELTANPVGTVALLHARLGLPPFVCDPSNVQQLTNEDDTVHGLDLHTVRQRVEPADPNAWQGILPQPVADWLDKDFSDIQHLARRGFFDGLTTQLGVAGDRRDIPSSLCADHSLSG